MMKPFMMAAAAATLFTFPVLAADITVESVWARASAGMARAGAAFMTIKNTGDADKLLSAKADVSQAVELHTHIHDNGVMKMRQVENIAINKGMTMLQPGGDHVMFMSLNAPFEEGKSFPLTLVFEKAGEITVNVDIQKAGAMGKGAGAGMGHGHGQMK